MAKHSTKGRRVGSTKKHGRRGTRSQCGGDILSGGEGLYARASGPGKVMSRVLSSPTEAPAAVAPAAEAPATEAPAAVAALSVDQKQLIRSVLDGAIRIKTGVQLYKITIGTGTSFSMTWTKIGAGAARSLGRVFNSVSKTVGSEGTDKSEDIAAANILAMYESEDIKNAFLNAIKGVAYSSIPNKMTFTNTLITLEFGIIGGETKIQVTGVSEDQLMKNIVKMYTDLK